ncbi:hypothetical protein F4813DRAFT_346568 [Daldinia decipiens]|uniref:uncharacterized protein n=1 Tax=Daldinia decipiens TaxID=326647 RepID=UPI0020C59427|nr:uncharacterized protein F4813DRAFT_346568 [Daldinia decipiens]KAI1661140.1 hypothetical protein F4813DRAFT_346568 [Daldinia decipiens]
MRESWLSCKSVIVLILCFDFRLKLLANWTPQNPQFESNPRILQDDRSISCVIVVRAALYCFWPAPIEVDRQD